MSSKIINPVVLMSFIAAFLVGCGGGGGGGGGDAPQVTQPPAVVAPSITTQPQNVTVNDGASASFSVNTSGSGPLSIQWKKNGVDISGAASSTLNIAVVPFSDNGAQFTATVSNSTGSVTSASGVLTVLAVAPTIVTSPQPQTVVAGNSATFSVVASGTGPLALQWRRNGVAISGAIGASYTTPVTTPIDDGGSYDVVVSNSQGVVASATASLQVALVPNAVSITTHPQNTTLTEGGSATFSVAATGTGPFTYQWLKNGAPIRGGYEATLKVAPATMFDNGSQISVAVSNTLGTSTSNVANLTVSPGAISLLLGRIGGWGNIDGPAELAHFGSVCGLATDNAGNLFASDAMNHSIRKIDVTGVTSTLAGLSQQSGSSDGTGLNARFNAPEALTVDSTGNIYVVDSNNDTIRKITSAGVVTTLAGVAGNPGAVNGTGISAQFNFVGNTAFGCGIGNQSGIAIDSSGNIYVADSYNHAIRKITPGGSVSTFAGALGQVGYVDGASSIARFDTPTGLAIDAAQNIYVIDRNQRLRKISSSGDVVSMAGTLPMDGGTLSIGSNGDIFLASYYNIYRYIAGNITTLVGSGSPPPPIVNGSGSSASFGGIAAIVKANSGGFLVADRTAIRYVNQYAQVSTFAGNLGFEAGFSDGPAATAAIDYSGDATADGAGNIYFTGPATIRMLSPAGIVSTIAGVYGDPASTDGSPANARFVTPSGITRSSSGNIYVSESTSHTIRKIAPNGDVATIAGLAGSVGFTDGSASASRLNKPGGIAVDAGGNIYFADRGNFVIRKISASGTVSTIAGLAGAVGGVDGTGNNARFTDLHDIAIDSAGNLFVTDNYSVRKITPAGVVTTFAGSLYLFGAADGNGAAARFVFINGITIDSNDNLYVVDGGDTGRIRKITPSAQVTTVAGTPGVWGIQLGALPGSFDSTSVITWIPGGTGTRLAVSNGFSMLLVTLP